MPSFIDHIVIASADLDIAIANARLAGFRVVPGGVHGSGNTHNALIAFADGAYLELFAPTVQGRRAEHRWFPRISKGGGLVDYCLLGEDLATEVAQIRARGIEYSEPFSMTRLTPSGCRIEWKLSTAPRATGETGWPFIIEDTTARSLRVPQGADEVRHANGAKGVAGITVLARDIEKTSSEYAAILGRQPQPHTGPGSERARVFSLDRAWIQVREPASPEETQHLDRYGQGPYSITLLSRNEVAGPGQGVSLDPSLFSGAKIHMA
jgi:hypothetical protein